MGAVSAFTTGNYHGKPLMTDVIVIHKNKNKLKTKDGTSAKVYDPTRFTQFRGHPLSTSKKGHLILTNIHSNHKKKKGKANGRCESFYYRELPL